MPNINTAVRYLAGASQNPNLFDWSDRFVEKDNADFLAAVARDMRRVGKKDGAPAGMACIGLSGEYGLVGYRLRQAQAVLRIDRTPSHWSHCFVFADPLVEDADVYRDRRRAPWLWECSIQPEARADQFARRYGTAPRRFDAYVHPTFDATRPHCVPNLAVIAITLTDAERQAVLDRADQPAVDQLHYDIPALLGCWSNFLARRDDVGNPLADGHALYSSAYVQLSYEAAGIDLAPGAHQRNVSPEHLWQTANYLYRQLARVTMGSKPEERRVFAWVCLRDKACLMAPLDAKMPGTMRASMKSNAPARKK